MIYYNKNKVLRAQAGTKTTSEVDWDAVRNVNDNGFVQTAKVFDPTGVSSYPDVYYAIKDYKSGKGSGYNVALNLLGALPIIGKAKTLVKLAKMGSASKAVTTTRKGMDLARSIAAGANKVSGAPINLARPYVNSSNSLIRGVAKTAVLTEKVGTTLAKPFSPKVAKMSTRVNDASDYKNLAVDLTDTSNFIHDIDSSVEGFIPNRDPIIDRNKAIVYSNDRNTNVN